jgi:hypothetical protein
MSVMQILVILAALIVLAEALNKVERTDPRCRSLSPRMRLAEWLKAIAWGLLATGSALYLGGAALGGAVWVGLREWAGPLVLMGFAILVVRTRVKEG